MRTLHRYYDVPQELLDSAKIDLADTIRKNTREQLAHDALTHGHVIGEIESWEQLIEHHTYDDEGNPTGETIPMTRFVAEALIIEEN